MAFPFIIVITVGILGVALQWIVLRIARRDVRVRTQEWLDRAVAGGYRRQTRDDAISELERSLTLTPSVVGLRKLGIMAPLLGVVLTASSVVFGGASVTTMLSESNVSDVPQIIQGLAPLLAGVTVGALLAIINQVLLIAFHRTEDRLVREATAIMENEWFRDTDDRFELVVEQIAAVGLALQQMTQRMQEVVLDAAAGGERLNQAVSVAAERLQNVSGELKMAVEGPSREFVVAAEQLSKAAKTGSTQFAKVAKAVENMQESGFDRIENVQRQQLETLRQETDAIGQLRLLLSRAEDLRVTDWNASFTAAAESAETMKQSMASVVETLRARTEEFQIGLGGSTDAVRSAMKRLEGCMGDFEARCRLASEAVAATSLKSDEINRVRDGMRELADALASTLRSIQSPVGASSLRGTGIPWFRSGSSS